MGNLLPGPEKLQKGCSLFVFLLYLSKTQTGLWQDQTDSKHFWHVLTFFIPSDVVRCSGNQTVGGGAESCSVSHTDGWNKDNNMQVETDSEQILGFEFQEVGWERFVKEKYLYVHLF